jgi:hypothetical protein
MQGKPLLLFGDCFTISYLFAQGEEVVRREKMIKIHTNDKTKVTLFLMPSSSPN